MKFDKYYVAAAAFLTVILIVVFTQRSDWDANKYILSADDAGNLEPKSEKYFDDKEKALFAAVDQKIKSVPTLGSQVQGHCHVFRATPPERWPLYCHAIHWHSGENKEAHRDLACHEGITCPAGSVCVRSKSTHPKRGTGFGCFAFKRG